MPPKQPGRPAKSREVTCPDCNKPFIPVNINQKRCIDCIRIHNETQRQQQEATKLRKQQEALAQQQNQTTQQSTNPKKAPYTPKVSYDPRFCDKCGVEYIPHRKHQRYCPDCRGARAPEAQVGDLSGTTTCVVCGKEFETKNIKTAKYCSKDCEKSTHTKANRDKKETVSDNQKIVRVKCQNPECPNGGSFETTWDKYRKGARYCDRECNIRANYLKSKKYQRDIEDKRNETPQDVYQADYEPHPAQMLFHNSRARFKVLIAGIRFGKDRSCLMEGIAKFAEMLSENRSSTLVPRVHFWIVAPNFPLTRQIWRELKKFFPPHWIVNKNEAEHRIETIGDGLIEIKSAHDPDSLVSTGIDLCILSEFSRFGRKDEVWSYIRGRISSPGRGPGGRGGLVLINGTPKGRDLYHEMYGWGQDPEMPDWESWQFPSLANPHMNPQEIEDARKVMPARLFSQEYEAQFLTDGGDVFLNIDAISTGVIMEPERGTAYFASWDPAEKGDFSCYIIINDRGDQVFLRRWTGVPYSIQINEVEYYCKKYNHAPVHIDCTAAGSSTLVQALIQRGVNAIETTFSNVLKAQWVSHFAILCENKEITLLSSKTGDDAKAQVDELKSYTYTYTSTGKISYHHLPGQHDDCVDALLLAYKEYHAVIQTLPYIGLLLGGKRKLA